MNRKLIRTTLAEVKGSCRRRLNVVRRNRVSGIRTVTGPRQGPRQGSRQRS
ncbi:MAG: hypothetical protein IPM55_16550 [Acidobacteria bacterium]|nr:hypothetical protein [Acidobacteriota bacterium]